MSLAAGTRLGPYEIVSALGAGGMGEVYRARDTRLGRDVALKILPDAFAGDPERLARFDREAKLLASLNHPNIAVIHGVEHADGHRGLVMELVTGEDLSQLIARGPIRFDEARSIAKQIAEALEAAHEIGIIHRDLKPANVKVRPDGTVKVLDFGLAKMLSADGSGGADGELTHSPTITSPLQMTTAGMILGTAAYMSPEQARGRAVDRSADLWAFGCVLYEMLTGQPAFQGDDVTEVIAAVVKTEPDWARLPASTPLVVQSLLRQCLRKPPRQRLSDARAMRLALEESVAASVSGALPAIAAALPTPWWRSQWVGALGWVAAATATLATLILAFMLFGGSPSTTEPVHLSVSIPRNSSGAFVALSPNGRQLVLSIAGERLGRLYVRPLDSKELLLLAGTEFARGPFWSSDGRFIGFFAENKLKIVPLAGGPARTLCEGTGGSGAGTWNRDNVILFSSDSGPLRRVDAGGGSCVPVGNSPLARTPQFLPDGEHFFYTLPSDNQAAAGVYLASLTEPVGRKLLSDFSGVVFVPARNSREGAHVLFLRDATLMAQSFSEKTLQLVGDPFAVAQGASFSLSPPLMAVSAAANRTLVYVAGQVQDARLTWFDRTGAELGVAGEVVRDQVGVALSPDVKAAAFARRDPAGTRMLWVRDLARGHETVLTKGEYPTVLPAAVWSPDGHRLWFGINSPQGSGLFEHDFSTGRRELVIKFDPGVQMALSDWSSDGQLVVYTQTDAKTRGDIWYVPVKSGKLSGNAVQFLGTPAVETHGQISPDGKWLAYSLSDSGGSAGSDVYVRAFPTGGQLRQISINGGVQPRWRADGKELYFLSVVSARHQKLMMVPIASDNRGELQVGTPRLLFEMRTITIGPNQNIWAYSPDREGKRFLVNALKNAEEPTINVITHWQQAVRGMPSQ